ncbi:Serine proteases trypsin domain [Trinorchestia longiramus]|nr:Serine proteases trypsin domain [Trinorchestia longiramus]
MAFALFFLVPHICFLGRVVAAENTGSTFSPTSALLGGLPHQKFTFTNFKPTELQIRNRLVKFEKLFGKDIYSNSNPESTTKNNTRESPSLAPQIKGLHPKGKKITPLSKPNFFLLPNYFSDAQLERRPFTLKRPRIETKLQLKGWKQPLLTFLENALSKPTLTDETPKSQTTEKSKPSTVVKKDDVSASTATNHRKSKWLTYSGNKPVNGNKTGLSFEKPFKNSPAQHKNYTQEKLNKLVLDLKEGSNGTLNSSLAKDIRSKVLSFINELRNISVDPSAAKWRSFRDNLVSKTTNLLDPEFFLADQHSPKKFQPEIGGICITTFSERGVCVPLTQCPTLHSAAQQTQFGTIPQFLATNACRFSDGRVYFCCSYYTFSPAISGVSEVPAGPRRTPHPAPLPGPLECGEVKVAQNRIIGGTAVQPGAWPWLAAVGNPRGVDQFVVTCSGSLITRRHVLSAAHCFYDPEDKNPTHVRMAETNVYSTDGPPHHDYVIVARHDPHYYWTTKLNDLMVLTLDRDVQYSDFIQPVCLPFTMLDEPRPGRKLQATGFGLVTEESDDTPEFAHTVTLEARELARCEVGYTGQRGSPIAVIDHRSICAGGDQGVGICNGDSGGPLHQVDPLTGRYTVVGVMIASNGCGLRDFPSISTRVAPYLPWLQTTVT